MLIATTCGLWFYILSVVDLHSVISLLSETGPAQAVLCIALAFLGPVIHAIRWVFYAAALELRLPLGLAFKTVLACQPASILAPLQAGDLLRAVILRRQFPLVSTASSIILEKAVGLLLVSLFAVAGWVFGDFLSSGMEIYLLLAFMVSALAAMVALGADSFLALGSKLTTYIPAGGEGLPDKVETGPLLVGFSLSLINWLLSALLIFACFHLYGAPLDYWRVLSAFSIAALVTMPPVTLGGVGARETALLLTLKGQAPSTTIVAVCLLYSVLVLGTRLMVSIPFGLDLVYGTRTTGNEKMILQSDGQDRGSSVVK